MPPRSQRPIFGHLTISNPPSIENGTAFDKWMGATVREWQRFATDIENYLVQDIEVARVTTQKVVNGDQIISDGLFVELYADSNVTMDGTQAIRHGSLGSWLILHNVGPGTITIPNGAGTQFSTAINLASRDIVIVRYDGTKWFQVAPKSNN
jgi:hypothetical protein